MLEELKKVSNQLTGSRFLLIPIMWIFALKRLPLYYLGFALLVCGITDVLDGYFARKLNQVSELGSRLDSWADNLLLISAIFWVAMLLPEVFKENVIIITLSIGCYIMFLILGLIKFNRFANLHLYTSKTSTTLLYIFLVHAFLVGQYNRKLFILAASVSILSAVEGILLELILPNVDEHIGSILFVHLDKEHPIRLWFRKYKH